MHSRPLKKGAVLEEVEVRTPMVWEATWEMTMTEEPEARGEERLSKVMM